MFNGGRIIWETLTEAAQDEILARVKCIKQLVQSVERNAKFHFSHVKARQFFAENATQRSEDTSFFE